MRILESTDHKHLGEYISISGDIILFQDGEYMEVENMINLEDNTVVYANSNYQIRVEV